MFLGFICLIVFKKLGFVCSFYCFGIQKRFLFKKHISIKRNTAEPSRPPKTNV